jgi:iron complex outermembrane receptor protein
MRHRGLHASVVFAFLPAHSALAAQDAPSPATLPDVTVTATRVERESFDLPVSIDSVNRRTISEDRPQVNLSESLNAVPGIVVQNRQNYAQDLQISSRGFGARSTFGIRGLRLFSDGIPATMPDGQGQAATFDLDSAERIEVMRGPFAALYGNASGGVIQVFTADGPPQPTMGLKAYGGSYGTYKFASQYGAQHGPLNANITASEFHTDGYREHSEARRDHAHGKLKLDAGSAGTFTFIGDAFDQPDTQDPLGLTAAQVAQNPRQAGTNAIAFNTRKTVTQNQGGLVHDLKLGSHDTLQSRIYTGDRQVTQYLAIPLAAQNAATSAGGVVDLDRSYGGAALRWTHSMELGPTLLDFTTGYDYDRMGERRRGFINNFGVAGALKRDENDTVRTNDVYAQTAWRGYNLVVLAGVRHSKVRFNSQDYFIAAGNPNDSGAVTYTRTSPVSGVTYEISPRFNVHVNAGKGFETPTFAELAYRPDGQPGLNFSLKPAISTNYEMGAKYRVTAASHLSIALFRIDVTDEIVVASNSGGRTTFQNASRTKREGVEIGWQGQLGHGWEGAVAYSYLHARFTEPFTTGTPPVTVPAGNRLPGVPASTFYSELVWREPRTGFHVGAEVRYSGRIYVDDANSQAAPAYTIANVRAGFEQRTRRWRLTEFVRVDNIADRQYIGSVIVAEANGRYYEPAPGRNWLAGVTAQLSF